MRSIDLAIVAGSQEVRVFKAVKRFDPSRLLGPTIKLLRSAEPLHIETDSRALQIGEYFDSVGLFRRLLHMLEELEQLQVSFQLSITDTLTTANDGSSLWVSRSGTKSDILAAYEAAKQRQAEREVAAEFHKTYKPPEPPAWEKLFNERWERLGFDGLLAEERDYILIWELHAEVSNGSFDQYLSNSSGDHALHAVDVLRRVGSESIVSILAQVLASLPGGWCADRKERNRRLSAMPNRWEVLRALTDAYYATIDSESKHYRLVENIYTAYLRDRLLAE